MERLRHLKTRLSLPKLALLQEPTRKALSKTWPWMSHWILRLFRFGTIFWNRSIKYLCDLIPSVARFYQSRKNKKWSKLGKKIKTTLMHYTLTNFTLDIVQPLCSSVFGIHGLFELQSLVKLRVCLIRNKPKFNRNLYSSLNPLCAWYPEQELAFCVSLHCHLL